MPRAMQFGWTLRGRNAIDAPEGTPAHAFGFRWGMVLTEVDGEALGTENDDRV